MSVLQSTETKSGSMQKMSKMIAVVFLILQGLLYSLQSVAWEAPKKSIIVLDASGSMWGQIEGKAKIDIARNVLEDLLKDWSPDVHIGITTYGHRRKGDCSDIESVIPLAEIDRGVIISSINRISPKGKTPLTKAVKKAAEELKYLEDKATVILLSDGKETCDMDPCALGNELEMRGIDFTAHVIGFDVSDEEAAGLKCLATNTGGLYLPASNAGDLSLALKETSRIVSEKPPENAGVGKIWLDKHEFVVGEEIKVHFEAMENVQKNAWIGIVPSSVEHGSETRNDYYDVSYQYLQGQKKGTLIFQAPGRIDNYDLRMHDTDYTGNEIASVSFTMSEAFARLALDKSSFVTGEKIQLTLISETRLSDKAWIGIIPSDIPHGKESTNDEHDVSYRYLSDGSDGMFEFYAPSEPGNYDFRLNDTDENGSEITYISFTVAAASGKLVLEKQVYTPGEAIKVSFQMPVNLSPQAWVGIVPSDIPHGSEAVNDKHDISYRYLQGKATGSLTFRAPLSPGKYDLRAHDTDNNGTEITHISFEVK